MRRGSLFSSGKRNICRDNFGIEELAGLWVWLFGLKKWYSSKRKIEHG